MGTSHNSLLRPFLAFTFLLAAWVPANTRVVMVWLLSGHVMDPFLSRTRGCFTKACDQACEVESSCGNKIDIQNKHCNYIFRSYILIYFVEKTYTKVNKTASMIYIYIIFYVTGTDCTVYLSRYVALSDTNTSTSVCHGVLLRNQQVKSINESVHRPFPLSMCERQVLAANDLEQM